MFYFLCCLLFFCGLSGFHAGERLVNEGGVGSESARSGYGKAGMEEHRHGLYHSLGDVWLINPTQADRG